MSVCTVEHLFIYRTPSCGSCWFLMVLPWEKKLTLAWQQIGRRNRFLINPVAASPISSGFVFHILISSVHIEPHTIQIDIRFVFTARCFLTFYHIFDLNRMSDVRDSFIILTIFFSFLLITFFSRSQICVNLIRISSMFELKISSAFVHCMIFCSFIKC